MSTQLADKGNYWEVSTVTGFGSRKKLPRDTVRVPKGNKDALLAEMTRQADAARMAAGVAVPQRDPVV